VGGRGGGAFVVAGASAFDGGLEMAKDWLPVPKHGRPDAALVASTFGAEESAKKADAEKTGAGATLAKKVVAGSTMYAPTTGRPDSGLLAVKLKATPGES
jgi:hypothetical protein